MTGLLRAALRTSQWTFAAVAMLGVAQIIVWALDRRPPFVLLDVVHAVAVPGESVVLTMAVRRDVSRHCAATFTRWVFDGKNVRIDLEGQQTMSAASVANIEARAPGRLTVRVPIPISAFPGLAELVTDVDYVCNPLQKWWPINVISRAPFEIVDRDRIG